MASTEKKRPRGRPPETIEDQENLLNSLANKLVEQHLRDGTASSQILTQILKQSSPREVLERQRLVAENKLLLARVDALENAANTEELYSDAIRAMSSYQGRDEYYDDRD